MNRKRILAMILLSALLLTLWGCGKEPEKEKEKVSTTAETTDEDPAPKDTVTVCLMNQKVVGEVKTRYAYDQQGFLLAEKDDTTQTNYTYDDAGRLILKEKMQGEERLSYQQWVYDEGGNLTEFARYEGETLTYREAYTYDENGRATEKVLTQDGKTYDLWYRYDENGVLQAVYEKANGDRVRATYTYDANGFLIEESWFSDTEHVMQILRTYYSDGTLCKEEYKSPIRNTWTWEEFLYNQQGQLTMHLVYDRAVEVERQEYRFNEHGDLMDELHFENGVETYHAEYYFMEQEVPAATVAEALQKNQDYWMEDAVAPDLKVFAFRFAVVN